MATASAARPRASSVGLLGIVTSSAVAILVCALYSEVLFDLASEWWTQSEASYGILIPPFAFYVAYLKRNRVVSIPAGPDLRGLGLVLAACVALLLGKLASEFFLSRISVVFLLGGLIWTFWGFRRLRVLAFPLVFLLTMVPPPAILYNAAAAPLQLFASKVATDFAQLLGVSVFRDGNIIHLATTSLGVAEACSGLHSLSALIVASLLLGFLEGASLVGRVVILAVSVPLAIAVNVFRVTGTAILADVKPELALGYYHAFSGWLVFVMGLALLWSITKCVVRVEKRHE